MCNPLQIAFRMDISQKELDMQSGLFTCITQESIELLVVLPKFSTFYIIKIICVCLASSILNTKFSVDWRLR